MRLNIHNLSAQERIQIVLSHRLLGHVIAELTNQITAFDLHSLITWSVTTNGMHLEYEHLESTLSAPQAILRFLQTMQIQVSQLVTTCLT